MDELSNAHHRRLARRRRATLAAALTLAATVVMPVTTAGANEPNNGRSFCANSGPPAGDFAGDIFDTRTYGSAGEVVSWFSQRGIHSGPFGPWGQVVKAFCDPRTR